MFEIHRSFRFCASRVLARPDWSQEKNQQVYGSRSHASGHGHNFRLTVVVSGDPDPETGRVIDAAALDELVEEQVVRVYDHKNLNLDVPTLRGTVPTLERLLVDLWERLFGILPAGQLLRLCLREDEFTLGVYAGPVKRPPEALL